MKDREIRVEGGEKGEKERARRERGRKRRRKRKEGKRKIPIEGRKQEREERK